MKLNKLGPNQTEITTANGTVVFFSYNTPVAANLSNGGFIRTENKYSTTTSKHINKWLEGRSAEVVSQETLNNLVN